MSDAMDTTNPTPQPDRRRCRRRLCTRKMLVTCLKGTLGLGRDIGVRLHDFSEDGIRLVVTTQLAPGEDVEVGLSPVFQSKAVTTNGTVIWSGAADGGYWAGIQLSRRLTYAELGILT
jgi:PilZ domain